MKKEPLKFKIGDMVFIELTSLPFPEVGTIIDIDEDLATPYYIRWHTSQYVPQIDWWSELFLNAYNEPNNILKELVQKT